MLYYANDLIVSKTGKFYRIIERDPTRSTRQRTLYRVRRLSDGREMKRAYQPFTDFWRAPQEAEAALDAGDVAGATRAALAIGYPVDAAAAAEDADEVEVEAIVVEVEANDDAPPPPRVGYTLGKQQRAERARAQVRLHPLALSELHPSPQATTRITVFCLERNPRGEQKVNAGGQNVNALCRSSQVHPPSRWPDRDPSVLPFAVGQSARKMRSPI